MEGINATYRAAKEFSVEDNLTDLLTVGKRIKANCQADGFKFGVISTVSYIPSAGITVVNWNGESDSLTSNLSTIWYEAHPHMEDGRPIVRSDTRPLNTSTYFTMDGDAPGKIGGGDSLMWDFSNDDNLIPNLPDDNIPDGYKAKQMNVTFSCPVHIKDGCVYFFDAPWGSYLEMEIVVPTGHYYPNPAGVIPAAALGLPGSKMYAQATEDTVFQKYLSKHFVYGSCPMGDELNAEGAAVDALPIGWKIRGLIVTPDSDNISKGYASLEMYRCHTAILPGQGAIH